MSSSRSSGHSSQDGKDQALDHLLADEAFSTGAQGPSDADLPPPFGGPNQKEAGDVRAGDEEDQGHRPHEEEKTRARTTHGEGFLRKEPDAVLYLFRMQLADPGGDALRDPVEAAE